MIALFMCSKSFVQEFERLICSTMKCTREKQYMFSCQILVKKTATFTNTYNIALK